MKEFLRQFVPLIRSALRVIPIILGLAGLTLVIAWISGVFQQKIPPGETNATVRLVGDRMTDEVHEVNKSYIEEAVGTLKAANRSEISAKVLATIQQIHVVAGDYVSKDDLLISLNTQELEARLNQAREAKIAAEAASREAKSDFQRNQRLIESNAVSRQEYDVAERRMNVAEAEVRRASQAVKEAEVYLSYSQIKAPKDGRIVDRLAEPGDTTQPGRPLLTLYDAQSLRLEAPVTEGLAVKLTVGQQLTVKVDSIQQAFTAVIDEVVPQADAASRSFLVKASLSRSDHLYEGMYGRLQIPAGIRRHLCLSTDAIVRIGQLEFVDVVSKDGTLQRRLIKTGRMGMPGRVEVLSGVDAEEEVVLVEQEERVDGDSP